jgi:23S rRNA (uracil1939-C5)-methyltransferase
MRQAAGSARSVCRLDDLDADRDGREAPCAGPQARVLLTHIKPPSRSYAGEAVAAPVTRGEELDLSIDSLAYGGNGVARLNGFVVFVRGGLPGDRVRARVTKTKRGFAEAVAEVVLEPSPSRVEAPCRHFGVCGGCRFQDLRYESQVAAKEQQVRDALVRIGRIAEPPLEPVVPAASEYGYRNKLEYSFTAAEDGVDLGFHRAGRWDEVIGIQECLLTTELGNAVRLAVRDWAREEKLEPYDQETGEGYLRHLVYREGRNTGQALVLLVTAPGERFETGYLVDVLRRFPEVRSIHWAVNDTPAERTNLPSRLLWGEDAIEERILGLRFRVRPGAFLQTNTEMAERLYELAREYACLTGAENVFDLYCGTGTIGLALAGRAQAVWGVEISEESVACAIENAELNGIGNARFYAGNVGQALAELVAEAGSPDVVVVDPPRAGLAGKALRRTGKLQARRIVYVSCNPTTLASDVQVLRDEFGYALVRTRPVDMFPHTPHVETVSLLERT